MKVAINKSKIWSFQGCKMVVQKRQASPSFIDWVIYITWADIFSWNQTISSETVNGFILLSGGGYRKT